MAPDVKWVRFLEIGQPVGVWPAWGLSDTDMSWLKLLGILHKLAEKIPDSAFPVDLRGKSQSQVLLELEALEAATSATVDAAVRQLSRGNTVLVSATERYFLKLRI